MAFNFEFWLYLITIEDIVAFLFRPVTDFLQFLSRTKFKEIFQKVFRHAKLSGWRDDAYHQARLVYFIIRLQQSLIAFTKSRKSH